MSRAAQRVFALLFVCFIAAAPASQEKLVSVEGHTESVVIDDAGSLIFTDVENNILYRFSAQKQLEVILEDSGGAKGLALDDQGRILMCQALLHRVLRIEKDGSQTVLADRYEGLGLNYPNDLEIWRDGSIYFTDSPSMPYESQGRAVCGVYRIYPDGRLKRIIEDLSLPNGIAFSPDGSTLYVLDTNMFKLFAYGLDTQGEIQKKRIVTEVEMPDGMAVDKQGNLYLTEYKNKRIKIISTKGDFLGDITLNEEIVSNVTFSPKNPNLLYVTAGRSIYHVTLD